MFKMINLYMMFCELKAIDRMRFLCLQGCKIAEDISAVRFWMLFAQNALLHSKSARCNRTEQNAGASRRAFKS